MTFRKQETEYFIEAVSCRAALHIAQLSTAIAHGVGSIHGVMEFRNAIYIQANFVKAQILSFAEQRFPEPHDETVEKRKQALKQQLEKKIYRKILRNVSFFIRSCRKGREYANILPNVREILEIYGGK